MLTSNVRAEELCIAVNERDIYRYTDENGQWHGKDIELAKALFARTSHTFNFVKQPWPRVLKSLELGEVDMTLSAIITPTRESYAHFSTHPFRYNHYMLFVRQDRLDKFKQVSTLQDLTHAPVKVAVIRGVSYSNTYNKLLYNSAFRERLVELNDDKVIREFAHLGRADGYIYPEIEGKLFSLRQSSAVRIQPFIRVTKDDESMGFLMFSKKSVSPHIVQEMDMALKDLHQSGEYDKIANKYLLNEL